MSLSTLERVVTTSAAAETDPLALLKASNLSDLANKATARTSLELGSAATKDENALTLTQSQVTGLTAALAAKADDAAVLKLTGDQTVGGVKTFSSAPVVPDGAFAQAKITNLVSDLAAKAPAAGPFTLTLATAATDAVTTRVTGDTQDRFIVNANGVLEWGSGSAATDTLLYRSAADYLRTDDDFRCRRLSINSTPQDGYYQQIAGTHPGTTTSVYGVVCNYTGPATATSAIVGSYWQARSAAASFTVAELIGVHVDAPSIGAGSTATAVYGAKIEAQTGGTSSYGVAIAAATTGTLWLSYASNPTTAPGGILFGSSKDTNLYRLAAGVLKTDGSLGVGSAPVASAGTIRLPWAGSIGWRNFTDNADVTLSLGASGLQFDNVFNVRAGASSTYAKVGGTLVDVYADVGSSGGTETDLHNYSVPASTLNSDGQKVTGRWAGTFVSSGATKRLRGYFGGSLVFDSGDLTTTGTANWDLDMLVVRVSSSTVRVTSKLSTTGTTVQSFATTVQVASLTLTNAQTLKVTGQGTSTNDVVLKLGTVGYRG